MPPQTNPITGAQLTENTPTDATGGQLPGVFEPPVVLMDALRQQESGGRRNVLSKKGALGPYQFMKGTWDSLGKKYPELGLKDRTDPEQARRGATVLMRDLLTKYEGDPELALAAYNWGEGGVDRWQAGKTGGRVPKETAIHGNRILTAAGMAGYLQSFKDVTPQKAAGKYDPDAWYDQDGNKVTDPKKIEELNATNSDQEILKMGAITRSFSGGLRTNWSMMAAAAAAFGTSRVGEAVGKTMPFGHSKIFKMLGDFDKAINGKNTVVAAMAKELGLKSTTGLEEISIEGAKEISKRYAGYAQRFYRAKSFSDLIEKGGSWQEWASTIGEAVGQGAASSLPILGLAIVGGPAGAAVGAYIYGVGDIYGGQLEVNPKATGDLALAGGFPYAAAEWLLGASSQIYKQMAGRTLLLGRKKTAEAVAKAAAKRGGRSAISRGLTRAFAVATGEAITEPTQEIIIMIAKGFEEGKDLKEIFSGPEWKKQLVNAFFMGFFGGGGFGVVGGLAEAVKSSGQRAPGQKDAKPPPEGAPPGVGPEYSPQARAAAPAFPESTGETAPEPSPEQIKAGNYSKRSLKFDGLEIAIENERGSIRRSPAGVIPAWQVQMPLAYGYIKRTTSAEGKNEQFDVFVNQGEDGAIANPRQIYVIDQINLETGEFDEHKGMIGAVSAEEAIALYAASYSDGKGRERGSHITSIDIEEFKDWLKNGDMTQPISDQIPGAEPIEAAEPSDAPEASVDAPQAPPVAPGPSVGPPEAPPVAPPVPPVAPPDTTGETPAVPGGGAPEAPVGPPGPSEPPGTPASPLADDVVEQPAEPAMPADEVAERLEEEFPVIPDLPADDDYAAVLQANNITVDFTQTKNGKDVWQTTGIRGALGDTINEHKKALGASWFRNTNSWSFWNGDPTETIARLLRGETVDNVVVRAPDRAPTGEAAQLLELRERSAGRVDERADGISVGEYVGEDTQQLIRRGIEFGIPEDIVSAQIEDVAWVNKAFQDGKPLITIMNEAGTGKTFVLGGAIRELREAGAERFIYFTTSQDLIAQIKNDLAEYDIEDVEFHTYAELSGAGGVEASNAVLIFDEGQNVKNIGSNRGRDAQPLMEDAAFTIVASATPFQNPVEAEYLAATQIFNEDNDLKQETVPGSPFRTWARMFGARLLRRRNDEFLIWPEEATPEDGMAARDWFFKRAMATFRPMSLPVDMLDISGHRLPIEQVWVDMYDEVVAAYAELENLHKGNPIWASMKMHSQNMIKRILEASKVEAGIERAKNWLSKEDENGSPYNVVMFVETKSDRELGLWRQTGGKGRHYTYTEMSEIMAEWEAEAALARKAGERAPPRPFAEFIVEIARIFDERGIRHSLPSAQDQIVEALGGPEAVGIYTGSVTQARATQAKENFLAGNLRVLIATMAKGGTGLSLHDTKGDRPTVQININMPWAAWQVEQVTGRIARYGLQSKATIEWWFASNIPWEANVLVPRIARRLQDMGAIVKGMVPKAAEVLSGDFDLEGEFTLKDMTEAPKAPVSKQEAPAPAPQPAEAKKRTFHVIKTPAGSYVFAGKGIPDALGFEGTPEDIKKAKEFGVGFVKGVKNVSFKTEQEAWDAAAKLGVKIPDEFAAPEQVPKKEKAKKPELNNLLELVGYSQTQERGRVAVYLHKEGPTVHVTAPDAPLNKIGVPQGMRRAPTGTLLAAFEYLKGGDVSEAQKHDKFFEPTKTIEKAKPKPKEEAKPGLEPHDASVVAEATGANRHTVITVAGREVEVEEIVVPAESLLTSDNPRFPEPLQPRDRSRKASTEQIVEMAANLDTQQLGESRKAADGAPIVGPDAVVESGNGRVMAIRMAYEQDGPSAKRYREFVAKGRDVTGIENPVLVRRRIGDMSTAEREKWVRELNERDTLDMSATEQAVSDAKILTDDTLSLYRGGAVSLGLNRSFVNSFLKDAVSKTERASLIDADGKLSQEGIRRVEAAMFVKAYDDAGLVRMMTEDVEGGNIKRIAGAMLEAAPRWARMRSHIADGTIPEELDVTEDLVEAANLVRNARLEGQKVTDMLSQGALFDEGPGDGVKQFVRIFFNDDDLTKPTSQPNIAGTLNYYATETIKIQSSTDMFGAKPLTSPEVLVAGLERRGKDAEQADIFESKGPAAEGDDQTGIKEQRPRDETGRPEGTGATDAERLKRVVEEAITRSEKPFGDYKATFREDLVGVAEDIKALLEEMAPKAKLLLPSKIEAGGRNLLGLFDETNNLIYVALEGDSPITSARHEVVHWFKANGFYTKAEWKILEDKAPSWFLKYHIAARYSEFSKTEQIEEAIAEAFSDFELGKPFSPGVRGVFERMSRFIRRLGNLLAARGFRTWEDVFEYTGDGEMGRRGPTSDPTNGDKRRYRIEEEMAPEDLAAIEKWRGFIGEEPVSFWAKLKNTLSDNLMANIEQAMLDDAARFKHYERLANEGELFEDERSAFKLSHLSRGIGDTLVQIMHHGSPVWMEGAVSINEDHLSPMELMARLHTAERTELYEIYRSGERAKEMLENQGVKVFGERTAIRDEQGEIIGDEIHEMIEVAARLGDVHTDFAELAAAEKEFHGGFLDFVQASGLIGTETRRFFAEMHANYVPYNRVMDGDEGGGPATRLGFSGQHPNFWRMKGGEQNTRRPFINMEANIHRLTDAAVKNVVMLRAEVINENLGRPFMIPMPRKMIKALIPTSTMIADLKKQGFIIEKEDNVPAEAIRLLWSLGNSPKGKDIVSLVRGGKVHFYRVTDPLMYRSMTMLHRKAIPWIGGLRLAKHVLTTGVTATPGFQYVNTVRDTMHGGIVNHIGWNPILDPLRGLDSRVRKDANYRAWAASGAPISLMTEGLAVEKVLAEHHARQQRGPIAGEVLHGTHQLYELVKAAATVAEHGSRIGAFMKARSRGASLMEAAYIAREFSTDFSMRGDWAVVRFFAETVPFLNAGVQGLWRTYRGAKQGTDAWYKINRAFAAKALMMTAVSLAIYFMNRDDERFQELPAWERDTYFHFWISGQHFKIPKPFEVGGLFGTMPERVMELALEGNLDVFGDRMAFVFQEMFRLDVVPQAFRPIMRVRENWDEFRGKPIVPPWLDTLLPEAQYTEYTGQTVIQAGQLLGGSPMKMESLVRGYFGTLGSYALQASDYVVGALVDAPEPVASGLWRRPVLRRIIGPKVPRTTRYLDEFYEMRKEMIKTHATIKRLMAIGEYERAQKLLQENAGTLILRPTYNRVARQLSFINRTIRAITRDKLLTSTEKADRIEPLYEARQALARMAAKLKSAIKE